MDDSKNISTYKTRQQLASEYGLSRVSFWRKLKKHGLKLGTGLVSREWQKKIYESLGYPSGVSWKEFRDVKVLPDSETF